MKLNILKECEGAGRIGISGHVRPDGDCVGSCLALWQYLKKCLPDAYVKVFLEAPADIFRGIKGFEEIDSDFAEEEPFVCCIGTPLRLKSEEAGIRIWGRLDLTGENMAKLTEEGFTLSDARQMQLVRQEQALKQTELKYSAILAMICLSVPFFLHSAWKMKYHGNSLEWYDRKKDGEE